jgi:PleD family two-component response regulator
MAHAIRGAQRESDTFACFSGEEFIAILPFTDFTQAHLVAEKLRVAV